MVPIFRSYRPADRSTVIALLDANIPQAFAPNERSAFGRFLDDVGPAYQVATANGEGVAAYLLRAENGRGRINWLMAHPKAHGQGLGRAMMEAIRNEAHQQGLLTVDIAASQVSEGFYSKFGAKTVLRIQDGWGPGMHRVDMEWTV